MGGAVSLYNVLKARKTRLSPDLYTLLRARWEMSERVITAEPPIYFKSDGTAISEYQISGDTVQNGTPTPDNPIEVMGVGDRTSNSLDFEQLKNAPSETIKDIVCSHVLYLHLKPNAYYTMMSDGTGSTDSTPADLYRSVYFNSTAGEASANKNNPVTLYTDDTGVVYVAFLDERTNAQQYLNGVAHIWINEGNTPSPYEPYGYKIPITLNSVTQNIYLDKPLYSGDYIKRNADGTGVLHQDGADTPIALPQLSVVKGNNELNISTTVTPEITLKGKIKQLPDSNMNALLSVMEEM